MAIIYTIEYPVIHNPKIPRYLTILRYCSPTENFTTNSPKRKKIAERTTPIAKDKASAINKLLLFRLAFSSLVNLANITEEVITHAKYTIFPKREREEYSALNASFTNIKSNVKGMVSSRNEILIRKNSFQFCPTIFFFTVLY